MVIIKSTEEEILSYDVIEHLFSQIEDRILVRKTQRKDSLKEEGDMNRKSIRLSSINLTNKMHNNKNMFKDKLKKLLYNNQKSKLILSIANK